MKNPLYPFAMFQTLVYKILGLSVIQKIIATYVLVSTYFYYVHESHLQTPIILILISSTLLFSVLTLLLTIYILNILFQKKKSFFFQLLFLLVLSGVLYWLGFFSENGGFFLFLLICLGLVFSWISKNISYQIIYLGVCILVNSLLSFSYLQASEVYLLYLWNQQKYGKAQEQLTNWNWDEKNRLLSNANLPLYLKVPEELFFHSSQSLSIKSKSGVGQFLFAISGDQFDISTEPSVRFFLLPEPPEKVSSFVHTEYTALLEVWKKRGEVEEVKELGENILSPKKWKGEFWAFFNRMTPKYNKAGYYITDLAYPNTLVIEIVENLTTEGFHSKKIEPLLHSISPSVELK